MKKFLISLSRVICRLIASVLWQLVWLFPLWGACWYGKMVFPQLIREHFGLEQMQNELAAWQQVAELMKSNTSLTNPTALMHYLSAQLSKLPLTAKINTLEVTCGVLQSLCVWGLNLVLILSLIYAIIRAIRLYRSKTETYETAVVVVRQLQPQLAKLHQEICTLQQELQDIKTYPALVRHTDSKESLSDE